MLPAALHRKRPTLVRCNEEKAFAVCWFDIAPLTLLRVPLALASIQSQLADVRTAFSDQWQPVRLLCNGQRRIQREGTRA